MSVAGKGLFDRTDEDVDEKLADRVAERALRQRERTADELRKANARIAELESEVDGLEVQLQQLDSRAARLAGTVRALVNRPTEAPSARQGKLLTALQLWDSGRV